MRDEGHPVVENSAPAKSTREVDDGIFKKKNKNKNESRIILIKHSTEV